MSRALSTVLTTFMVLALGQVDMLRSVRCADKCSKGLYIAGSPFENRPWTADSYSPLDLTLLDQHFGDIAEWRRMIDEMHARGMYVVLDNTFATLGDLIGFDGFLNDTAPFTIHEHQTLYKTSRTYVDFDMSNQYNESCEMPRFWNETGFPVDPDIQSQFSGCYASEFDQYGDTEAFGVFPDWRRQLSKFASVQDRLREWHAPTRAKIEVMYGLLISQLDIDGFRYDKAQQATVDAMAHMNRAMRAVARKYGKNNFFIAGELTGGNDIGSLYLGRGRQPDQRPDNLTLAVTLSNQSTGVSQYYLRDSGYEGLDAHAFSYSLYRSLTRFLGMDGNLEAGYDVPRNWVDMHNTFLITNDLVNPMTGKSADLRHGKLFAPSPRLASLQACADFSSSKSSHIEKSTPRSWGTMSLLRAWNCRCMLNSPSRSPLFVL